MVKNPKHKNVGFYFLNRVCPYKKEKNFFVFESELVTYKQPPYYTYDIYKYRYDMYKYRYDIYNF